MIDTSTDQGREIGFISQSEEKKKLLIVCSKGTLDMAFPPFMMATSAAALDWEVHLYFTFWGMDIVTNAKSLKISPLGNPSMGIPNILSVIPGMTTMATYMMKKKMKETGMPSIDHLIKMAKQSGVKFHACSPTMELSGITKDDLIPECNDIIGATTFIDMAGEADVTLFI
ncbi:MAG: DsrE/DsrF/DrsH-like family protein [Candidatus Bathyarchaeota archaeon]|jgi:peroxiredoxin family protein|nr:DsrE/DsrF/DrsH-like family protein [Candidatus Bathyarchaeota archaeon]